MTQSELIFAAPVVLPSTCTLYHGDCLDVMPRLEASGVQFMFCDLPYGVTHQRWDSRIELAPFWDEVNRLSKANGALAATCTFPFGYSLMKSNLSNFRYDIVWHKSHPSGHANANCRPLTAHENILIFSQGACNPMSKTKMLYNPQKVSGIPYSKGPFVVDTTGTYGTGLLKGGENLTGDRHPTSIQSFKKCASRAHPTQKPVALLEWLIATYTDSGDTVLDPVAGSGTTAVAAARIGRNCIAIEKDAAYFDVMVKRVSEERAKLGLAAPEVVQ